MKSSKNVPQSGDLADIAKQVMAEQKENPIPANAVMVNTEMMPSKGVGYNTAMYVTPLTTQDLKNLNTMTEENATARINGVLASCVHGVPLKDILQGDKLWLLFYIRSVTYDDFPIFIKYKCKDCGRQGIHKVTMKNLNVRYYKDTYEKFLELPKSGAKVELRLPTIRYEDRANSLKNQADLKQAFDPEILDLCIYIESINGERASVIEAYNFLFNMNAYDFSVFSNYLLDNNFGIVPTVKIPCECGMEIEQGIGFTPDFFMPNFAKYKDM